MGPNPTMIIGIKVRSCHFARQCTRGLRLGIVIVLFFIHLTWVGRSATAENTLEMRPDGHQTSISSTTSNNNNNYLHVFYDQFQASTVSLFQMHKDTAGSSSRHRLIANDANDNFFSSISPEERDQFKVIVEQTKVRAAVIKRRRNIVQHHRSLKGENGNRNYRDGMDSKLHQHARRLDELPLGGGGGDDDAVGWTNVGKKVKGEKNGIPFDGQEGSQSPSQGPTPFSSHEPSPLFDDSMDGSVVVTAPTASSTPTNSGSAEGVGGGFYPSDGGPSGSGGNTFPDASSYVPSPTVASAPSSSSSIYQPVPSSDVHGGDGTTCPCLSTSACACSIDEDDGVHLLEYEFAMVREEAGSPDTGNKIGVSSSIGLNGFVHDVVYFFGERSYNRVPSGTFTGWCTMIMSPADLLCTYEISLFNTDGPYGVGGVIVRGPVNGEQNFAVVTGLSYDLEGYKRGSLETEQDPKLPILYTILTLYA